MADDSAAITDTNVKEGNESPPDPATLKSLKIKVGVVKRLIKDKLSYEKEATQQRTLVAQYESDGKEAAILRNARDCLKETEMMIPDVCRRLSTTCNELKEIIDTHRDTSLGKTPEFQEAVNVMKDATTHLVKLQ